MKYKHKQTGLEATKKGNDKWYSIPNKGTIIQEIIENSNDWELVQEFPIYVQCIECILDNKLSYSGNILNRIYKAISSTGNDYILEGETKGSVRQTRFKISSKEQFDQQELQNSIKSMEHGKWYKVITNNEYIIKFDKIEDKCIFNLKGFNCITLKNIVKPTCDISNVKSLSPATNQEVEQYFPNEFRVKVFTTEDGVDVFEGDIVHWLIFDKVTNKYNYAYPLSFSVLHPTTIKNTKNGDVYVYKIFNTKEKAQAYLDSLKSKEETLLEKARKLYPIGTKFISCLGVEDFIDNVNFHLTYKGDIAIKSNHNTTKLICEVKGNKWAEIIQPDIAKLDVKEYKHPVDGSQFSPMQLATIQQMIDVEVNKIKKQLKELQ